MSTRQWAVGQVVDTGHRDKDGKSNRMIIAGQDNNIYQGCLVCVDEQGKVSTMSVRYYQSYNALIVQETDLQYKYSSQDQVKRDVGLFLPYFKAIPEAPPAL